MSPVRIRIAVRASRPAVVANGAGARELAELLISGVGLRHLAENRGVGSLLDEERIALGREALNLVA